MCAFPYVFPCVILFHKDLRTLIRAKKGEVKDIMERIIRNAAKALIIKDDKMLAIKISDGKEEWYIMPGGGQDVEELLPETVCREVAEEMGLQVDVKDLAFVIEGLHGEKFETDILSNHKDVLMFLHNKIQNFLENDL